MSVLPIITIAQTEIQEIVPHFIEGKILEESSLNPIPFAKVINHSSQKKVLANENGYFKIEILDVSDSVTVHVITYQNKRIDLKRGIDMYEVLLTENFKVLSEITVVPKDNSHLYRLLQDCRKNQSTVKIKSKVYYELKSFVGNKQVELVENFYNGNISGYELESLDLKTGRFAMQDFDNTFFGSMESAKAITMMKFFRKNEYFPHSPFEFNEKMQKKHYYLRLQSRYLDENQDSVYVLEFIPRDKSGNFFTGRVFVNPIKNKIIQVELHCEHAKKHPFMPLFPTDTIRNLDLHITKSFEEIEGEMVFKHIDFAYQVTYKNRDDVTYITATKAILYAYDFNSTFILPYFKFHDILDYKKINAIPYNDFFWENHEELKLSDQMNQNQIFYYDSASTTNRTIFLKSRKFNNGFLECPYVFWSDKRIKIREFLLDTLEVSVKNGQIISELYHLEVKISLDYNPIADTIQILTATAFDPYESYYKLPLDKPALCFINVYFDLVEIERRNLDNLILKSDRKLETIEELYNESQLRIKSMQQKYNKEVEHGTNQKAMEKWNEIVVERLNINNVELFQPYN